ncbi:Regulatory protein dniR (fragment) [Capnocytophaga canimorsus]
MKTKSLIFASLLCFINVIQGQQPQQVPSDTLSEIEEKSIHILDNSEIESPSEYIQKQGIYVLKDHPQAESFDRKWLSELTNSELFFQMSEAVANQPTSDVIYEELPTEVLKSRLEALNQKTPFNIEYNPILERVIKSFLKNRRSSLERLMSLSDYYFPNV